MSEPERDVRLRDVAPRLAFQAHVVDTAVKVELVDRLTAAGLPAVEVSSFVRPDLVPGLADAAEVFARVRRPAGVSLECCVANTRGLQGAIDAGAHKAWFLLSADEVFSRMNIGRGIDDSLAELGRMAELARDADVVLGTYVVAAFGGPLGPPRGPEDLERLAPRLLELGVREWILADSCGYAAPTQMREMVTCAAALTPIESLTVQVHDSRGLGLACAAVLPELGLRNLDGALAGSGGHPAAPEARVGGVCTEDMVQLLELQGVRTGVDLPALIDAANWLADELGGLDLGFVRRSGAIPAAGTTREAPPLGEAWSASTLDP